MKRGLRTLGIIAGLAIYLIAPAALATEDLAPATPPEVQDVIFLGPMRPLVWRLHVTIDGKPFREVWQARLDGLIAKEDAAPSGRVTLDAARSIVRQMDGSQRELADAGETSRELAALASDDGAIPIESLVAFIGRKLPPLVVSQRAAVGRDSYAALFALLDVDGDHQLSPSELEAAANRLAVRDFNDDRTITRSELIIDPQAALVTADAEATSEGPRSPIVLLNRNTSPEEIADKLLAAYDRDRDARLATSKPTEINLPKTLLRLLDTNADGLLDRTELARFVGRTADIELYFALGKASVADSRARPRASETAFRVRKTLESGYSLKLPEANVRIERDNADPAQADLVRFRNIDRDNNGYLELDEATAGNVGKAAFSEMDLDGDGKVFKPDFDSFMDRQNAAAALRLRLEVMDLGQNLFDLFDFSQDELLSARELQSAVQLLELHDANGDGLLNTDEVPQDLRLILARGTDGRPDPTNSLAGGAVRPTTTSAGPLWFRKMDRNGDGDLDRPEFLGPQEAFDKLDVNHDRLIDVSEAEQAD